MWRRRSCDKGRRGILMSDEPQKKLKRKEVKEQLETLACLFQLLPKSKFQKPINETGKVFAAKNKPKQDSLQETIDYLRVCIKYTLYDAESLRREILQLKKLLKDNGIS